jgi:TP901 family phage tail tape measure protein
MLPKQLMFTVGLIDQITKPIAKISKQFNGLSSNYQAGTMKAASGMAGMAAAGYALTNAMQPAIDMDRALGEVKSLGVRDSALKELTNTAYDFSLKYGKSATEFISSSYDIQSAISGLNDADLSAFTLSSNVLATATKSDAATITNYMGTMFGIFKNQANSMGKSNWVEQVTGMTASAVQMFKTNGSEMSAAFTSIGAEGQSAGIGMNEQMAVLGTLQATMSGSEAGTKYKAFLAGVGKAQKSLGLEFTNSQGKMLPMVDILTKIKGKYGETLDVAESDALGKAFGSKEAAATVKLLMNDIDTLGGSIGALGKVKGMEQAEKMAAAMTDQSDRLSQSWFVIRAAFGTAILPVFNSFASWLANVGRDLVSFTEKYPTLTKYIGYAAVSLLGLVAAGGLLTVMVGASTMAMTTWKALVSVAISVGSGYSTIITFMQARLSGLSTTTMLYSSKLWLKNKALTVSQLVTSLYGKAVDRAQLSLTRFHTTATFTGGYLPALSAVMKGAALSTWTFVASLAAAALPITLIIGAVGLLAVAVYKYWQPIKAFFGGFWDGLTEGFAPVGEVFGSLFESFSFLGDVFSWIGEQVGFSSSELAAFADAGKSFGSIVAGVFSVLMWPIKLFINLLTGAINLVKDGIGFVAELFGFGGQSIEASANITTEQLIGIDSKGLNAETAPKNVMPLAPLVQTVPEVLPKNVMPLSPLAQTVPDILPKNVVSLAPLTQTVPEILPKNVMPLAPLAQTVPEVLPKNVMPLAPLAQTVPEVLPKNVMPLSPLAQTVPQPLQKQNTPVASIQAIAPIKSRVENGGITQQISNANQKKSTSIGNVTIYPAKGETNFMNLVEMHG